MFRFIISLLPLLLLSTQLAAKSVSTLDFGFSPTDATDCLQKAFDSGAARVIIKNTGKPYFISRTVQLRSNQEIILEPGVIICNTRGSFKTPAPMFICKLVKNITICGGKGSTIKMTKADFRNQKVYSHSEHRHILTMLGADNITIKNLILRDSGGDMLYLGGYSKKRNYNSNILIENVIFDNAMRLGIGAISVKNLTVRNCVFKNAIGAPPQGGIDFEPNKDDEQLVNCLVENCTFLNNRGMGCSIYAGNLSDRSKPVSVTVKNCRFSGNGNSFYIHSYTPRKARQIPVKGKILIENCTTDDIWQLRDPVASIATVIRNCTHTAKKQRNDGVLQIHGTHGGRFPLGNIRMENFRINDNAGLKNYITTSYFGNSILAEDFISGNISIKPANGKMFKFDLKAFCKKWRDFFALCNRYQLAPKALEQTLLPPRSAKPFTAKSSLPVRRGEFVQFAERNSRISIDLTAVDKSYDDDIGVTVYTPNGAVLKKVSFNKGTKTKLEFTAPESGIYRIAVHSFNATILHSNHPGNGWSMASSGGLTLLNPKGDFYFRVPEGIKKFAISVNAAPSAGVALFSPDGKRKFRKTVSGLEIIECDALPGVWKLNFSKAKWSVILKLFAPLNGIVSSNPETLFEYPKVKNDGKKKIFIPKAMTGKAIQEAIDLANRSGGGKVVLQPGVYLSGTIRMKSNVELNIPTGSIIRGYNTPDKYDDFSHPEFCNIRPEKSDKCFITAYKVENIAITGGGIIDGCGPDFYKKVVPFGKRFYSKPPIARPRMLQICNSKNIRLTGVTYHNAPGWTMWIRECKNVEVENVFVRGDQKMINNDGVDFDGCQNVTLKNSVFITGDDCVVLRAMRNDDTTKVICRDVLVENCYLDSACQGIRVGCPSDDIVENCVVRNVKINGYGNGIYFNNPTHYLAPGDNGFLKLNNLSFSDISINSNLWPIKIDVWAKIKLRQLNNVTFRNIKVNSRMPISLKGNSETQITNIVMENISGKVQSKQPLEQEFIDLKLKNFSVTGGNPPEITLTSDPAVNTLLLQNVLDAGGTIRLTTPGTYDVNGPLFIGSDTTLEFAPGVFIRRAAGGRNQPFLVNKGILKGEWNENIKIIGLHLLVNGVDVSHNAFYPGLRGHLSFLKVRNLTVRDYECSELVRLGYGIHICTFRNITLEKLRIEGNKDGVHLSDGRYFTIRDSVFCTYDDAIALNAYDFCLSTAVYGNIEDGLIENCTDLNSEKHKVAGYFCRMLGGAWKNWHKGMTVQNSTLAVYNGHLYSACFPVPSAKAPAVSQIPPTHRSGIADHGGISWRYVREHRGDYEATCRRIICRNITLQKPRIGFGFTFSWGKWAESVPGKLKMPVLEELTFEKIHCQCDMRAVFGGAAPARNVRFADSVLRGKILFAEAYPGRKDEEYPVMDVTFSKVDIPQSSSQFFFRPTTRKLAITRSGCSGDGFANAK